MVQAGEMLQLSCLAAPSNPPSELNWYSEGVPVSIGIANATTESSTLRPINSSSATSQVSLLKLRTTSAMNGKVISCQATNHVLGQSVHDAITLNIRCEYFWFFIHSWWFFMILVQLCREFTDSPCGLALHHLVTDSQIQLDFPNYTLLSTRLSLRFAFQLDSSNQILLRLDSFPTEFSFS